MFTKASIESYFVGEKQEAFIFLIVGIVAIGLAVYLFAFHKGSLQKGIAIPLFLIGLIQGIVGYTVWSRSDRQRTDMVYAYDMNPGKLKQEELPRMEKVMKSFRVYLIVELVLLALATGLMVYFRNQDQQHIWFGVGIGLACQCVLMLGADYVAQKRGNTYINGLRTWVQQATVGG